jgi:molybdenum cofactor biosynthesis protein B
MSAPDAAAEHRRAAPTSLGFAIVTVSDTRAKADDVSGRALRQMAEAAGHRVEGSEIVPDDVAAIRAALRRMLALPGVDVVLFTGGTGFSPRDLTLEAVGPLLDRPVEGFGELFRMLSYAEVGAAAMLSRAQGGVVQGRALFSLPGSPNACRLALDKLILPELGHVLREVRR